MASVDLIERRLTYGLTERCFIVVIVGGDFVTIEFAVDYTIIGVGYIIVTTFLFKMINYI